MSWYDLPEVALIEVLNHLPVKDQLNARLVCQHWKQITDNSVQRDELILFLEIYPRPVYWYHNGREADLGNALLVNKRGFLSDEFPLRYFRRVRRLMIITTMNVPSKQFLGRVQKSYQRLEHLQFSYLGPKCGFSGHRFVVNDMNLQLANLRTFYSQAGDLPLGLHCPKLKELYAYSKLNISETTDTKTKLCIKNLRTLLVHKLTYPPGFEFSNLELFYFIEPSPGISLSDFPSLKEIHYLDVSWIGNQWGLEDVVNDLLEQKRSLNLDQLRVYFDGFELNDRADFQVLRAYLEPDNNRPLLGLPLNEAVLRLIKEKPSRLKPSHLLCKELIMSNRMDNQLVGLKKGELVKSIFRSVQGIVFKEPLTKKKSPNLFNMSDRFRYVCSIRVSIELSQNHLDRLPNALPNLVDFSYHPQFFKSHFLNFKFIVKFKSLQNFHVHHRLLSIDELRLILENCKFINRLCYEKSNVSVWLARGFGRKVYKAKWRSSNFVPFASATFSLDELLDYFETSKWVGKKVDFLGKGNEEEPILLLPPPAQ